jgi:3-(methylthio)propionyl---CoA ligase
MLNGLMMQTPLLISTLIEHAARHHGDTEIVSQRVEGDLHRSNYRALAGRARQLANALGALGIRESDRVATLAWNGYRHMELYYAVSGSGAVLHTINPRLHPDQIAWIANDAEDQALFFDATFLPLAEAVAPRVKTVRNWVLMTDREHMPAGTSLPNLLCYEELLTPQPDVFDWPVFDENAAATLCYTSGTTGEPRGVLYSHRSTLLHSYAVSLPDAGRLSAHDVALPVVPMFHANAWGIVYAAPLVGAKLVFPGPRLDGRSLYELFERERVTHASGVPTVWQGLLAHMNAEGLRFSSLRRTLIGGAAIPSSMLRAFEVVYGVDVSHGWGMTEMSPVGTIGALKAKHAAESLEERLAVKAKQGRVLPGVDLKIVDVDGRDLPWDGVSTGELHARGPWVARDYFKNEGSRVLRDGWFPTGDVATIDPDGYMQITDRSKDLIKSGGEWISSIGIEDIAMSHPAVAMAACIGVRHPKWDERPLLVVVLKAGAELTRAEILAYFEGKVAKWQIPDDVTFVTAIPLGPTGKMLKSKLREQFRGYSWPAG